MAEARATERARAWRHGRASKPSTRRERKESMRRKVVACVDELEAGARQQRDAESAPPASPPSPETKPWREKLWGGP